MMLQYYIALFGAGLLVGGFVGLFTAALCKVSKMSDGEDGE